MKKVLIISYFFPPCELTGANRAGFWSETLHKEDYYPIVITRRWDHKINGLSDISTPSSGENSIDKNEKREVHYLKFRGNIKDRFFSKYGMKFSLVRRSLSFIEIIFQNLFIFTSPYRNFYIKAKEIIDSNPDISTIIISGMPFHQFLVGYKLKKKFKHIHWIADYRDEWTSLPNHEQSKTTAFLNKYDRFFEKKWVKTASCFTYVDNYYVKRIENLVKIKGYTIRNGYLSNQEIERKLVNNTINLTFAGTLYTYQNIEVFAEGIKLIVAKKPEINININFLGSTLNKGAERKIENAFGKLMHLINITDRIPTEEVKQYYKKSDALLMFSFEEMPGITPTKVLNYLPLKIPILFCPSDDGAIEEIINKTNLGFCLKNTIDVVDYLSLLWESKIKNDSISMNINETEIEAYSGRSQVVHLANLLKKIENS